MRVFCPSRLAGLLALTFAGVTSMSAGALAQTETSTAVLLPEEGGPMRRADMPEGGTPSWREPDQDAPEEGKPRPPHVDVPPLMQPGVLLGSNRLTVTWAGYVRVIAEIVENDALLFVGRNDGFRLGNARLEIGAAYGEDLSALVSIDAALAQSDDLNDPNAELAVGVRDAFLEYELSEKASVRLGRFKAPYDVGELESTGGRVFIDQPLESRGVQRTHGLETPGMSPDRQIGVMLHRARMELTDDGFDLGYAVALTNGKTGDRVLNDNDLPAGYVRLSLHWAKMITLNLGGFVDKRTSGELPNLLDDEILGAEGSLQLTFGDLRIEAQALFQRDTPETAGTGGFNSFGGHAQWAYRIWGFEPAYRFAYFEPNDEAERDVITEHTLGISYYAQEAPLRLSLNGTFVGEERDVNNNRVALLVQFTF